MEGFMARFSSDSELESNHLRNILESLINEISIPSLERRARSKSREMSQIEELSYIISELANRELDLETCVGISVTTKCYKKSKRKTQYLKDKLS